MAVVYRLILIGLFLLCSLSFLNAEEEGAKEESKDHEKSGAESENDEKSEKTEEGGYIQKLQRRYVSRLPYLMIPSIIVPIIKKGQIFGYLLLMLEIKAKSVECYRKLQSDMTLIRDEMYCDIYVSMSRLWIGPDIPIPEVLEKRLLKKINGYYKTQMAEKSRLHVMQFMPNPSFDKEEG